MRPRTPLAVARATGATKVNPGRYEGRERAGDWVSLGAPSPHLNTAEKTAWEQFRAELAHLVEADRALLEVACKLRAQLLDSDVDVGLKRLTVYRALLADLGASPTRRSLIQEPPQQGELFEEGEEFLEWS